MPGTCLFSAGAGVLPVRLAYFYAVLAMAVASKIRAARTRLARSKVLSRRCRVANSSWLILSFLISARRMAGSTSQVCIALDDDQDDD